MSAITTLVGVLVQSNVGHHTPDKYGFVPGHGRVRVSWTLDVHVYCGLSVKYEM